MLPPTKISVGSHGYAQFYEEGKMVLLHRRIMGLATGDPREVDHINFDRLDNRVENLRVVSKKENRQHMNPNRKQRDLNRTATKTKSGKWAARQSVGGGKYKHIGTFDTREEALG